MRSCSALLTRHAHLSWQGQSMYAAEFAPGSCCLSLFFMLCYVSGFCLN
jgi:hypothetical protein